MNTALIQPRTGLPNAATFATMLQMSETLVKSGILPEHIRTPQACFAIIQKGIELGIPPMHALQNIAFIKGKTTLQAELMLALVIRDEGPNALRVVATDNTKCTVRYQRRGVAEVGEYSFTIEDAKQAGLVSPGGMYGKYPAAMLRSRCISAVCRFVFPDVIGGVYTHEEMGAEVDEDGEMIAAHVQPASEPVPIRAVAAPAPSSLPVTRTKPQPNGAEETRRKIAEAARAKGLPITDDMTAEWMANVVDAGLSALGSDVRVIRAADGSVTARALQNAILAIPRTVEVDAEDAPITGEAREEPEDPYADIAAATAAGTLLPMAKD